ncbi:MAG: hypothetical protein PVI40_03615 [Chlamydiota bacterium]|jgi:hypothetical protein
MSVQEISHTINLHPNEHASTVERLYQDASNSVFTLLDITSLESFEAASSKALVYVTNYKIEVIRLDKIKTLIKALHEKLNPEMHAKERQMLEKIQVKVELKTIFPKKLQLLKSNVSEIRKSILEALKSLDSSTIENLKLITAPKFFEEIFEILEIYENLINHPHLGSYLFDLVTNGKVDIIFEAIDLVEPFSSTIGSAFQDVKFGLLAIALCKAGNWGMARKALECEKPSSRDYTLEDIVAQLSDAGNWDIATKALNLISDNVSRRFALESFAKELSKLEKSKAIKVTNLISNEMARNTLFTDIVTHLK